jgi:hypothetical protein
LLYIILIEIGENIHSGNIPLAGNNSSIISSLLKKIPGLSRTLLVSKDFPGLDFFLTNSRTFQDFQGPWGP